MGVVYKAVDTSLDRIVAIKALSAELSNNPDLEKRFRAEAKAQANLNHTESLPSTPSWCRMRRLDGHGVHQKARARRDLCRHGPHSQPANRSRFKQALY